MVVKNMSQKPYWRGAIASSIFPLQIFGLVLVAYLKLSLRVMSFRLSFYFAIHCMFAQLI